MPKEAQIFGMKELSSSLAILISKQLDSAWHNSRELIVLKFVPEKIMSYLRIVDFKLDSLLISLLAEANSFKTFTNCFSIMYYSFLLYSAVGAACSSIIGGKGWEDNGNMQESCTNSAT